jgi:hypothetical protein
MTKKCTEEQVRNPATGRCIKIDSALFKQLVKDGVQFSQEDVLKITKAAAAVPAAPAVPATKATKAAAAAVPAAAKATKATKAAAAAAPIKSSLKQIMAKYVNEYKERKDINYISKDHENICKNKKRLQSKTVIKEVLKLPFSTRTGKFTDYLTREIPFSLGYNKTIEQNYNNYNKHIIERFTNKVSLDDLDYGWFNDMNNYVTSLSNYDAFTILGYSFHSDKYINMYLTGRLTPVIFDRIFNFKIFTNDVYFPYYKQAMVLLNELLHEKYAEALKNMINNKTLRHWIEKINGNDCNESYLIFVTIMKYIPYDWWLKVMQLFRDDLKRIIENSPSIKKKMILYRGVKDDYMLKGSKDQMYTNNCFVSTSLSPYSALEFVNAKCCFKRIVLYPGQKALLTSGLSFLHDSVKWKPIEFLLNIDTRFYIRKIQHISVYKDVKKAEHDICFKPEDRRTLQVVDILMLT